MCLSPYKTIINEREFTFVCRKCDQCLKARQRKLIGRINAESQAAQAVWFCTFTYGGGEHAQSTWLHYDDLQKTFKKWRYYGHVFSYVSVGEYGSKHGRAHFHAIIMWMSEPPTVPMGERLQYDEKNKAANLYWEHGFAQYELPRSKQGVATYVTKYMQKENTAIGGLKYSKKPALGTTYLLEYARDHARRGMALFQNGAKFTIPDNVSSQTGKLFFYDVDTSSALYEKMLQAYLDEWATTRPDKRLPQNEHINDFMEGVVQDTSTQQPHVQDYIFQQYGYEPVRDFLCRSTYYTLDDAFTCVVTSQVCALAIFDTEGKVLWSQPVPGANAGELTAEEWTGGISKANWRKIVAYHDLVKKSQSLSRLIATSIVAPPPKPFEPDEHGNYRKKRQPRSTYRQRMTEYGQEERKMYGEMMRRLRRKQEKDFENVRHVQHPTDRKAAAQSRT